MQRPLCLAILLLQLLISVVQCFINVYPRINFGNKTDGFGRTDGGDAGEPLFLTKFVEDNNIVEGRRLARVPLTDELGITSYAGFFTVNKTTESNQYFWYFPAIKQDKEAPVLVWLQGGPGVSSLEGLFVENGPIQLMNGRLERRQHHWALNHHVIYIDNPVGTGFSFTKDPRYYCTDEVQIGEQLYSTIYQFFQLFPELQSNKFFVTGESYGGKYVPALAYTIHKKNPEAKMKINLKGVAIGNGFSDPEHQLVYSEYLYQIGLIDSNGVKILADLEKELISLIQNKQYKDAQGVCNQLYDYVRELSGLANLYNYIEQETDSNDVIPSFLNSVRKAIHVGNLPYKYFSSDVYSALENDIMQSVAPWVSELLDHYDVLTYNGQLDIMVAYQHTVNYLRHLNFTGADEYKTAERQIWWVDDEVAGYVKKAGRLVEVLVRNAGHMVPKDQPKWAEDLITRFTHGKGFS